MNEEDRCAIGLLSLVPTPIGNRGDMTQRAIDTLRDADVVACEDTRHSRPLLAYYGIDKPLVSYHQHNEAERAEELLALVARGEKVAVISDAGMPGVSDPGGRIVKEAQARNLPYTVLPGPSAAVTAVVAAGIGDGRYTFQGFMPRKGSEREAVLAEMDRATVASVFYEAPHRIVVTLASLCARWPEREFAVIREWTKAHEEVLRFSGAAFDPQKITTKGEFVVVVGPNEKTETVWSDTRLREELHKRVAAGMRRADAVRDVTALSGRRRNDVYEMALKIDAADI
ncbi:MAG: 16S rRNA (cytidine(1402)-2'-O)-methyltransferase [Peptoniphilaceae bacterium]|nr:16S rRNA (cytidine(1402)-2'-O)-methyltransferase [Peptoniphilaceae bacterium]MDY6085707.1 16S rRNA (cytidine(1402)-2'-O)-methyltransferase [Peptoniphilaceae bacterium]